MRDTYVHDVVLLSLGSTRVVGLWGHVNVGFFFCTLVPLVHQHNKTFLCAVLVSKKVDRIAS
jgi:hypothetical protein